MKKVIYSKNVCLECGFYDMDFGCICFSSDKWYACPIESCKPENILAMEEYISFLGGIDDEKN